MTFVRDLAIVLLAVESLVIGVVLIVLLIEVRNLIRLLRDEVKPILSSADETVRTVRGTTTFVSDTFLSPMIRATGFFSGVAQALRILTRRRRSG
ncbi:MAG: hypothetical protein HY327_04465 [Chloroflexi bacterium]|nr:hypothetical protein [Chloroflexota bacterium]